MRSITSLSFGLTIAVLSFMTLHEVVAQPAVQRSEEMEFDARVIQGQRAEGAVYLFQRAARPLPSLLQYRKSYLSSIVTPVFNAETKLGGEVLQRARRGGVKVGASAPVSSGKGMKSNQVAPDARAQHQGKGKVTSKRARRKGASSKKRYRSKSKRRGKARRRSR